MSDRGSVHIEDTDVRLYTHEGGHRLFEDVANALARGKSRWNDPDYLTRVIFDEMVGDDAGQSASGYGIGTYDARESTHIVLDVTNKRVTMTSDGKWPSTFRGFIDRYATTGDKSNDD